jgi:chemotaxis protein methyltransferase CheR
MELQQSIYQIDQADYDLVRSIVHRHSGISLGADKKSLVQARITKQIRGGGYESAKAYLKKVASDKSTQLFSDFIDAISTNLTSFFRENEHFKFLSEKALPEMMERKLACGDHRIISWSAACSSGEEPYSMGITLLEAAQKHRRNSASWDIRILGTDISRRILATARAATYQEDCLSTVPARNREKYFHPAPGSAGGQKLFAINPDVSSLVSLRYLNLMEAWPFHGPFDFIFCRNVMIYFDKPTQENLVERFWKCLAPGGLLFTGHSESLTGVKHRFQSQAASIYKKAA